MDLAIVGEIVKVYGPLGLGWVVAAYLIWFVISRYDKAIEANVKLATALEGLTQTIKDLRRQ
jgi:hypothetical protein